jgi:hypothetical protein
VKAAQDRHPVRIRAVLVLFAGLGSLMLFGLGLVAPLTPSHGCPTALDLLVFGCGPTLLAASGTLATRGGLRVILLLQAMAILIATFWLLDRIGCLS